VNYIFICFKDIKINKKIKFFDSVDFVLSLGIVLKGLIFSQPISGKYTFFKLAGNVFVYGLLRV